jgi:hypothetical protein
LIEVASFELEKEPVPRPNIIYLRRTRARKYWPSLAGQGAGDVQFDLLAACEAEECLRRHSAMLMMSRTRLGLFTARHTRRLIKRLDYRKRGKGVPRSLASSVYMRRVRDRVFSQLWRLIEAYPGRVAAFTAIKRGWEYTPEQLLAVDLGKLLGAFLSDINRRGAGEADGWLIAFIHGEYETPAGIFRLHLHGIVGGGMIEVVDGLRRGAKYRHEPGDNVRFRLRITRKPLTNLPYSLTYCLKSYWPWKHVVVGAHGKRRTRRHKRIPEPYHTLVLLFLDRHSLNDLVVLKHLQIAAGGLELSSQPRVGER